MGEALRDLLSCVESATGADREIDRAIECALFGGQPMPRCPDRVRRIDGRGYGYTQAFACHTASVDAALALVERVLPGWYRGVQENNRGEPPSVPAWSAYLCPQGSGDEVEASAATGALALLAALLRTLIAEQAAGPQESGLAAATAYGGEPAKPNGRPSNPMNIQEKAGEG